jgi:hypothetical protein
VAKSVVPAFISGALLALMMSTTGCSNTPKTVTKDDVANQIKQKKWGGAGDEPESVSCPQDLRPTVGATVVCEMTLDGQTYAVDVTVTGIDGDKVELDMRAYR